MQIYIHIVLVLLIATGLIVITIGFVDWLASRRRLNELNSLCTWDGKERRKVDKTSQ